MSNLLYGGFMTQPTTPFIIDKTYQNRKEMDEDANSDGIFLGRYVLIKYCNENYDQTTRVNIHQNFQPDNGWDENSEKYKENYNIDKGKYGFPSIQHSYDSTVWRKVLNNSGILTYEAVANLSTIYTPIFIDSLSKTHGLGSIDNYTEFSDEEVKQYPPEEETAIDGLGIISSYDAKGSADKWAFGEIFNDYHLNAASGIASHAEGHRTKAYGNMSHAQGQRSVARGNNSHAEGYHTIALGSSSHAEGISYCENLESLEFGTSGENSVFYYNASKDQIRAKWLELKQKGDYYPFAMSYGANSHVEGFDNLALGETSHAEGRVNLAEGAYSHVEGRRNYTQGLASHAEGLNTKANADYSHAEGLYNEANGVGSHAEGENNIASGDYSYVGGSNNTGEGWASFTHGRHNLTEKNYGATFGYNNVNRSNFGFVFGRDNWVGDDTNKGACFLGGYDNIIHHGCVFAFGSGLSSAKEDQILLGSFNVPNSNAILQVGMGWQDADRINAFEILTDGSAKLYKQGQDNNSLVLYSTLKNFLMADLIHVAEGSETSENNTITFNDYLNHNTKENKRYIIQTTYAKLCDAIPSLTISVPDDMKNNLCKVSVENYTDTLTEEIQHRSQKLQLHLPGADSKTCYNLQRDYVGGIWSEWKWENPPMVYGEPQKCYKEDGNYFDGPYLGKFDDDPLLYYMFADRSTSITDSGYAKIWVNSKPYISYTPIYPTKEIDNGNKTVYCTKVQLKSTSTGWSDEAIKKNTLLYGCIPVVNPIYPGAWIPLSSDVPLDLSINNIVSIQATYQYDNEYYFNFPCIAYDDETDIKAKWGRLISQNWFFNPKAYKNNLMLQLYGVSTDKAYLAQINQIEITIKYTKN